MRTFRNALPLLLALGCASQRAHVVERLPTLTLNSGTLVFEVRSLSDSALVRVFQARLERRGSLRIATDSETTENFGRVVFTAVTAGRYLARVSAIAYQGWHDSVTSRPNSNDTVRVFLDRLRCDLDCSEVVVPRRPWWKFSPHTPTI